MPQVVRNDIDNLNTQLVLTLTKADYEPKFKSELNKVRNKVQMKGFRKGKTPTALLKKMYGKKILVEVINEMVQQEIFGYIKETNLQTLGQPLPSEDQPDLDFDVLTLNDFAFHFDLGLAPQFELQGVDKDATYDYQKVQLSEEFLEEQVEAGRKRLGERETITEGEVKENDVVTVDAEELDGDELKENGWAATFDIFVESVKDEEVKKDFLSKSVGDKVRLNVFTFEGADNPDMVRKNLLQVGEVDADVEIGEMFEVTIKAIKRIMPAELNQEFFDKYMGPGKVSSVEEMKASIKQDYTAYYNQQADVLLYGKLTDTLLEQNNLLLPDEFLKRWLKSSDQNVNVEDIEAGYEGFAKSLRWTLIREKLIEKFGLKVTDDEVFEGIKQQVRSMFSQYGMGNVDELIVLNTANRMAEDEKQMNEAYSKIMNDRVFEAVKEAVTLEEQPISREEFEALLKAEVEKNKTTPADEAAAAAVEETPAASEEVGEEVEEEEV
ncbi:MAG: trigger factor [Bacteroidota bacterium]